ncbi:Hemolymph lipopolysaccharide-binding protein [Eumeta japonica]|uniref:Hemolymph lipopolysaccharide-binding protein n=1 Tax=Eumeta variegata TaxID=151549 RepID=A0A4C1WNN1_EUMVA|nr:Hemolymph lipopolysaccharide-binding protein [Eumeta japonica]
MSVKSVILTLGCILVGQGHSRIVETDPKYRTDYQYVRHQDAFYKVHRELRSWHDAYLYCKLEGGSLLYPKTVEESTLFVEMVQEFLPNITDVWVGAHDLFATDIYVDTDGIEISQSYAPWSPGEPVAPSRWSTPEHCVEMRSDSKLNNIECDRRRPFVCKKLNRNITINAACRTPDAAFFPSEDGTRCYKVHRLPKTWMDAFAICNAEQAYLSIINDKKEAEFIIKEVKSVLESVFTDFNKNYIAIGFHDKTAEGLYETIHGQDLNSVYHEWSSGQPDAKRDSDDCGALTVDGLIDDIDCDKQRMLFVCERDIKTDEEARSPNQN